MPALSLAGLPQPMDCGEPIIGLVGVLGGCLTGAGAGAGAGAGFGFGGSIGTVDALMSDITIFRTLSRFE